MNKKEKYILLGLFLFAIVLVNSYLSMTMDTKETEKSKDIKENFTGLINDVYKDFNVTTNNLSNKAFRQLRNSFRNNKETFQRSYRSFTRPVNKL
jgi:plasmid replication initiation protein|tara:strand:- start:116 stop:400 length:285 start_codon:yes stop_codon:yes gene_type:complete